VGRKVGFIRAEGEWLLFGYHFALFVAGLLLVAGLLAADGAASFFIHGAPFAPGAVSAGFADDGIGTALAGNY